MKLIPSVRLGIPFAAALLFGVTTPRIAHANEESWEVWTEFSVRVVPVRRLRLTFTENTRFSAFGLRRIIPEIEVDYRVIGPLRLGGGYRYLWRRDARGEVEYGQLVHGDARVQVELGHFDFEFHSRVQWRTTGEANNGAPYDDTRDMWRNRVNVEWAFTRRLTANAFLEQWTRFDDTVRHDRFRVGAGLSAEVSRWRFQLFYQRDMPDFIDQPDVNMVGISARMNLDLTHR